MITKHGIEITWRDRLSFWWDDVRDYFEFFGMLFVLIVLLLLLATGIWYPVAKCECSSKAEKLGVEYSFGLFQGCFVKKNDRWVDYDRYFVNESLQK